MNPVAPASHTEERTASSAEQLTGIEPERIFVAGLSERASRRTRRRLARYRVGMEGRISHLKRR